MNKVYQKLARVLPKRLVYFCYIQFMAEVTTFREGRKVTPDDMSFSLAHKLWQDKYGKI